MSLYLRGDIWWSRIVRHNQRIDKSTKQRSKAAAIRVESKWIQEIDKAGNLLDTFLKTDEKGRIPIQSLRQFEEKFFEYIDVNVPNLRTRAFYRESYKPLCETGRLGVIPLPEISIRDIDDFIQERAKTVGPARINASLRTLKRAMKRAEEWGMIAKTPKFKMVKGEKRREFVISEDLLSRMLQHEKCTEMLKNLLPFLIDTGLRISELTGLQWDPSRVGLEPKSGASLGWVYIDKGKSKYAKRYVPLTRRAHDILTKVKAKRTSKDAATFVFPAANGGKLSRHWVSEQFRALRNAMKLPSDCVIHSTRHTFCTRLGEAGAEAFTIQKLAGHSSVLISQLYVHPTPEILESAISRLGTLNGKSETAHA